MCGLRLFFMVCYDLWLLIIFHFFYKCSSPVSVSCYVEDICCFRCRFRRNLNRLEHWFYWLIISTCLIFFASYYSLMCSDALLFSYSLRFGLSCMDQSVCASVDRVYAWGMGFGIFFSWHTMNHILLRPHYRSTFLSNEC